MRPILNVFLLCVSAYLVHGAIEWIESDPSTTLPSNCIIGGTEGTLSLHIGRKQIDQELVVGKVIAEWHSGYFPKDGGESWYDTYEVLCGGPTQWITKSDDQVNVIIGGKAGNDEPFPVCRGKIDDNTIPGKLYRPTGCCYIPLNGKEHCSENFEILSLIITAESSTPVISTTESFVNLHVDDQSNAERVSMTTEFFHSKPVTKNDNFVFPDDERLPINLSDAGYYLNRVKHGRKSRIPIYSVA